MNRARLNQFQYLIELKRPQEGTYQYSKTLSLVATQKKETKIGLKDRLSLNADQKYCGMLQGEHSAILSRFIKLPFVLKIFVLSMLSGRLRQILLYKTFFFTKININILSENTETLFGTTSILLVRRS